MMFFTFFSGMFLDIISTLFMCYAIDKDNNVDLGNGEFVELVKEVPGYTECEVQTIASENDPEVPETSIPVAQAYPVNVVHHK
jgi:hypothetical protein